MKKKILLLASGMVISIFMSLLMSGQTNLLQNSDFETQGAWKIAQRNLSYTYTVNFGVTASDFSGSAGKVLEIAYDASSGGTGEVEVFVYQRVGITKGHTYKMSCAMKDQSIAITDGWIEIFWYAPPIADETSINENAIAKFGTWQVCNGVGYNGSLDTSCAVLNANSEYYPYIHFSDTTTADSVYVGINIGTWGTTANFDVLFDNLTFIDSLDLVSVKKLVPPKQNLLSLMPNPTNRFTTVSYIVPVSGDVRISLYNMLGQNMRTLVNEHKSNGSYTLKFDGSNLSDNIYFVRYESGGLTNTRKLILIR
jgi:hypothetical protein